MPIEVCRSTINKAKRVITIFFNLLIMSVGVSLWFTLTNIPFKLPAGSEYVVLAVAYFITGLIGNAVIIYWSSTLLLNYYKKHPWFKIKDC